MSHGRYAVLALSSFEEAAELTVFLERYGWSVLWASEGPQTVERVSLERPAVVITDSHKLGRDLLEAMKDGEFTKVWFISEEGDDEVTAAWAVANWVLTRPLDYREQFGLGWFERA